MNGDGQTVSNTGGYRSAFSGGLFGMGCPGNRCYGYELRANLTATGNWAPIANYETNLEGNGHTISGINVPARDGQSGVFTILYTSSVI